MEMEMPINPETLKTLREKRNLSQQTLAEEAERLKGPVGKRTIARIETGETPPEKVRPLTLERLAKALGVKPDDLCKPVSEISDQDWKDRGFTPIKLLIPEHARKNFRWVHHHYGLDPKALIEAAPWMAALLAEMSLAERRRQLEEWNDAVDRAMERLPVHLQHAAAANSDIENGYFSENESLHARDVFGSHLLKEWDGVGPNPFDPDMTNPFVDFLRRTAANINHDALDPDDLNLPFGSDMPHWPVFQGWLHGLTGGDPWARFAVENVKGVLDRMRPELQGAENTAERVQWLTDQIPPEMRAREETRLAKADAELEELLGVKL